MKGSEAIVRCLKAEKVKNIFGITGGSIMEVYDALDGVDESDLRHILVRHEQTAAHAASAYARVSNEVGVCMATSGPGATNLVTGIADAHADSSPVVALTGQVPSHLIGGDAFQEADIVGITLPITKHNYQVTDIKDIPKTFKEAFRIARTRRPGPVLIDIPKDMQQGEINDFKYPTKTKVPGYNPKNPAAHPVQVKRAVEDLMDAERPLILAGGGVILGNAAGEVTKLAKSLNIPVTTSLMGKGAFPEDHPLSLGMLGMHGRKVANLMVTECDVLLVLGARFSDRYANPNHFAPDAKIIHVDIDSAEIGKNVEVDTPIVGGVKEVVSEMLNIIGKKKRKGDTAWSERLKHFKKEFGVCWDHDCKPIKSQRVMKELDALIDKKTIITTEVGQCQMFAAHYLNIREPRKFVTSGGLGTMGAGFPFSIGAKVAKPDHWVCDVGSEGSFMMTCQDLATCTTNDIPVTVLLLKNQWLGMVKQWQDLFYDKRRASTFLGDIPDFVKLAESFKGNGIRVETPGEISEALKTAKKSGETTVIDVLVDPNEHILPMVPSGKKLHEMIESQHVDA